MQARETCKVLFQQMSVQTKKVCSCERVCFCKIVFKCKVLFKRKSLFGNRVCFKNSLFGKSVFGNLWQKLSVVYTKEMILYLIYDEAKLHSVIRKHNSEF